jgi:hypothetical protein
MKRNTLFGLIFVATLGMVLSFYLEFIFFLSIMQNPIFSFLTTTTFEGAKVLILLAHHQIYAQGSQLSNGVQWLNGFFKSSLIMLSIAASVAMIASALNHPNLEKVMAEDRALVQSSYDEKVVLFNSQKDEKLKTITGSIKEKYRDRHQTIDSRYLPEMERLKNLRDAQFSNSVNGVRRGAFYMEHSAQLDKLSAEYKAEKDKLTIAEDAELDKYLPGIESEYSSKMESALNEKEAALSGINPDSYAKKSSTKNEYVNTFLSVIKHGLGIDMSYLTFTLLFSALTGILFELVIYLGFVAVAAIHTPVRKTDSKEAQPVYEFEDSSNPEVVYADDFEEPASDGLYTNPIDEDNMAGPEIDPRMFDFFQGLNNQFGTPGGFSSDHEPENPCGH